MINKKILNKNESIIMIKEFKVLISIYISKHNIQKQNIINKKYVYDFWNFSNYEINNCFIISMFD
jgi:hypothetical protein